MNKAKNSITKHRLKKDDTVIVIAGRDKGKIGKIIRVLPKESLLLVEGVNMLTHHTKPSHADPEGGIKKSEGKIHISNVAFYDSVTSRATRLTYKIKDGSKQRFALSSKTYVDSTQQGK